MVRHLADPNQYIQMQGHAYWPNKPEVSIQHPWANEIWKLSVTKTDQRDLCIQLAADLKPSTQCQKAYTKASNLLGMNAQIFSYKSLFI